jgi:hypothetical protein
MNAGRRVNKLHVYAEPIVAPLNTSFDNVANTEVTSDLFHVDVLALVREGRVPCNDRRAGYSAQIRCQTLRNAVNEVFLLGVATDIGERQHHN